MSVPLTYILRAVVVLSFACFLPGCSKDVSGLYVCDADTAVAYSARLDLRSDGSAELRVTSTIDALLEVVSRHNIYDGKWTCRGNEVTIEGKDQQGIKDVTAVFSLEPNGDLVGVQPDYINGDRFARK